MESILSPNVAFSGELPCQALPDGMGIDWLFYEDLDSLEVRHELAIASVAALGDFWDNPEDLEWQNFQT